jgi:hypothetical protein
MRTTNQKSDLVSIESVDLAAVTGGCHKKAPPPPPPVESGPDVHVLVAQGVSQNQLAGL